MTWHQWQAEYPTERKIGLSSSLALRSASGPHGCQSTGLCACWSRYGLVSFPRRFGRRLGGRPSGFSIGSSSSVATRDRLDRRVERVNIARAERTEVTSRSRGRSRSKPRFARRLKVDESL